jgi:hypothetical protein
LALNDQAKLLVRLAKFRWERDFNALPFHPISVDVDEELLPRASWVLSFLRAARLIPSVQLPLIQRQTQDSRVLGVTQGRRRKHDKTL